MRSLNRTILKIRLFFSTFRQRKKFKGSSFIYELKDDNFKNLLPPLTLLNSKEKKELIDKLDNLKFVIEDNLAA